MIKVNLLTEKRAKPIPIDTLILPFLTILMVGGIVAAYFFFSNQALTWNDELKEEEADLQQQIEKQRSTVDKEKSLKSKLNAVQREINKLNQLSGANLVQWSQTFSNLTEIVPEKTVWITNFRVDSDRRVQITAYSCNEDGKEEPKEGGARLTKGIQDFIDALQKHEHFSEVFLTSATKNVYEKMPVWRFEINCRLAKELTDEDKKKKGD